MPAYTELPTFDHWLRDTSIVNERKGDDPILNQIDFLVNEIHTNPTGYDPCYLYGELYFATTHWLKDFKVNPKMKTRTRLEAAVRNLFAFVANFLAYCFAGTTVNLLPNWLEAFYGKGLTNHGLLLDRREMNNFEGHYMQRSAANEFKVCFMKGLAYQFEYGGGKRRKLQLANSANWYKLTDVGVKGLEKDYHHNVVMTPDGTPNHVLDDNWSYFVMSMSRDIYMGPQTGKINMMEINDRKIARYHSSWLGGTLVQCAGSILVENGVVKAIRNNSGHYAPANEYMVNVIEYLRTVGQDIRSIKVYNFLGAFEGMGSEAKTGKAWAFHNPVPLAA